MRTTVRNVALVIAILAILIAIALFIVVIARPPELPTSTPQSPTEANSTPSAVSTISQSAVTPPVLGNIVFDEDFDNNNNGWPTGKVKNNYEVYLDNGEYNIIGEPNGKGMWFGVKQITNLDNFYLEAKTQRLDDSQQSNDYGIHFRQSNLINYVFVINPDQQSYALLLVNRPTDQYTDLIHWVYSPRISTGFETNTIGILCNEDVIMIYLNGYRVDSIKDESSLSGAIGFVGGAGEHVAIDYLRIWSLK